MGMTAKEKAKELVEKFKTNHTTGKVFTDDFNPAREKRLDNEAKQCALTAVQEIIKMLEGLHKPEYAIFDAYKPYNYVFDEETEDKDGYMMQDYWQQVKEEIDKL